MEFGYRHIFLSAKILRCGLRNGNAKCQWIDYLTDGGRYGLVSLCAFEPSEHDIAYPSRNRTPTPFPLLGRHQPLMAAQKSNCMACPLEQFRQFTIGFTFYSKGIGFWLARHPSSIFDYKLVQSPP